MGRHLLRSLGAVLFLAQLLLTACAEDYPPAQISAHFPGFPNNWVAVHGTVSHPEWSSGRFVFKVYDQGTPPIPGSGQQSGSAAGGMLVPFVAGVPEGAGSVYLLAFNDVDGSMTHGATEWQACSGLLTIDTEDLFGIDLVMAAPPPLCP